MMLRTVGGFRRDWNLIRACLATSFFIGATLSSCVTIKVQQEEADLIQLTLQGIFDEKSHYQISTVGATYYLCCDMKINGGGGGFTRVTF